MTASLTILGLAALSVFIVYASLRSKQTHSSQQPEWSANELKSFKLNAAVYEVPFENCEFRDSSYSSEVEQRNDSLNLAGRLIGTRIGDLYTPVEQVETVRSVLFFQDNGIADGRRFYQIFSTDQTTLKYHVLSGHIVLLIDRTNRDRYVFEIRTDA